MPIRFRCVYCNQLLGISKRKAGTIIRCTTCEGQLIVPDPSAADSEPAGTNQNPPSFKDAARPVGDDANDFFEKSDFDAVLEPAGPAPHLVSVAPPPIQAPPMRRTAPPPTLAPIPSEPPPALALSRKALTIVCFVLVLGLGLSFAGGILLGRSMAP